MIKNNYVTEYIDSYRNGDIVLNKERIMLIDYIEEHVLTRDDIYFDETMIDNFIRFAEKWYFPLQPFQKFLVAFVFLYYKEDNANFFEQFLFLMARGAGKNGLITVLCHFFISELHGIPRYNVSIVANSELQARTSFNEMYDVIGNHEVLDDLFYRTKKHIESTETNSIVQYHTSNAETKDGLRDGCVIYDETHQYESFDVVDVFGGGLGKVRNSREFFIGTDGFVRDGFLDKTKERAMEILSGKALDDPLFPFICKIDDEKEVDNYSAWEKANPMFHEPMSNYARQLLRKVKTQHRQLETNPSGRENFMTKRMNLPVKDMSKSVATFEQVDATNRPMPDLSHKVCVGALDYSSVRDFTAMGLLFKVGDEYVWKTHSLVNQLYIDEFKPKAPIKQWEKDGHLTIVDEPSIPMEKVVEWFCDMRTKYGLNTIVADTFRLSIVKSALEAEGFNLIYIRNSKAASAKLAPKIETVFANEQIIYDDNPLMRWYTNNTYVRIDKFGNKNYEKVDEVRRKTDGFMAMLYAFWEADNILEEEQELFVGAFEF